MGSSKGELSDSDSDSDDGFNEDMEALKRACQLTGETPTQNQLQLSSTTAAAGGIGSEGASSEGESEAEGDDDDLQLVRSIQKRFAEPMDTEEEPLRLKPLLTVLPDWSDVDDIEEDYETLRAIQRRFAAYSDGSKDNFEEFLRRPEQVGATIIDSEKESSNSFLDRTNAREGFLNCVDTSDPTREKVETCDHAVATSMMVESNGSGANDVGTLPFKTSHFPNSALAFLDAIKKNRSCQKLIRSKMMHMEARMEELGKLIDRVRILKDFQVACKKRTGRALSQKKDPRVQLISVPKLRANMKPNEKGIHASYKGPSENVHVPIYKKALETFRIPFKKQRWSKEEMSNLVKGVKQQFQEMLLQQSIDLLGEVDGSYDSSNVDSIMKSIKDLDITPERMRSFLPKVNWEQLATMYVPGRTDAECQARFLNFEDPLINHGPWTAVEDKNLLHIIQENGLSNWIDIAASLGTNRTPFQCLARYQRSLNASILKREWTSEEDNQLRAAVETYGESNWQVVASAIEGRTGTQCSNRWLKTLHPTRVRSGKWTLEENKRLKVAVTLFGPKQWKKVAKCVAGRTHVQCRERWVNCLDPSLRKAEWTEEEDVKLGEAIAKHGYCWSKVAACIPHRTDNQCLRRWKVLFPTEVPLLQNARKIQKAALISNFVDRESERPALGPNDFQLPETLRITGSENVDPSMRKKKKSRRRETSQRNEKDALSGEIDSEEAPRLTDGTDLEMQNKGSRRSSRVRKSSSSVTRLLDLSDEEEIRASHVNDANIVRKSRQQKKRSRVDAAATTSVPVIGDEACSKDYVHSNKIEEPTTACPNAQNSPLDADLGGQNMLTAPSARPTKLPPRRRNTQKPKAVTNRLKEKDVIEVTGATKASSQVFATKERTVGNTSPKLSESSVEVAHSKDLRPNTDNAVSLELEGLGDSDRNTDTQHKEKATEAENLDNPQRKRKNLPPAAAALAYDECKRRKPGGRCSMQRSRKDTRACKNRASEVEVGDDVTLAQFLLLMKGKDETDGPKVLPPP